MDSLKGTLASLTELFHSRMNDFQLQLQKSPATTSTTSLASDFTEFKKLMYATLTTIQNQIELLGREHDRSETRSRRKMLLLHGVPEEKEEDATGAVTSVLTEKLKIEGLTVSSISRCHRLGRQSEKKSRPIIVKFKEVHMRDKVWFNKTKLKGSDVTMSEFLTRTRHNVFLQARQRYGVSKCWTREGVIIVLTPDGSRHYVESMVELDAIAQAPAPVSQGHHTATASRSVVDKALPRARKAIRK